MMRKEFLTPSSILTKGSQIFLENRCACFAGCGRLAHVSHHNFTLAAAIVLKPYRQDTIHHVVVKRMQRRGILRTRKARETQEGKLKRR